MDFREFATKETTASLQRAITRSAEGTGSQLEALRAALDGAAKALEAAGPTSKDEEDVADLVARLTKEASDAAAHAAKLVADEAQKAADSLRGELQATVKQKMAVAASLTEAQAQLESVRSDLKNATERGEAASRQLGEARKTNEKLETAAADLASARDELAKARAAAETELGKARQALEEKRNELTAAGKKYERLSEEKHAADEATSAALSASEASEAKLAAVTGLFKQSGARIQQLERAQQEQQRTIKDLEARLQKAASEPVAAAPAPVTVADASPLPVFDDLLSGFQALGSATTIGDVLATLVEQLAAQFPRVALFRVKKSHLQGEHQIGFDLKTDIGKVVIPLGMDSLLAHAASSGQIERLSGDDLKISGRAPFSGSPRNALAIPIAAAGETLAIVYADDSGAPAGADAGADVNARFAEAMQQHAGALIARLTNELKALAELQAYAASLLRELEQMHSGDVQAGMSETDLQSRLKGNLDYARSIYGSRIALEGSDAAGLLEEELASMIQTQSGMPFGRDLAVAAGRPDLIAKNAAEAS
jgi:hypothetical protein